MEGTATNLIPTASVQGPITCRVELPESWQVAQAAGRIELADTQRLNPFAVAADGSRVFGALYSGAWSGVVSVELQGEINQIRAFDNPAVDQANGNASFDGRWFVWEESHSLSNWSAWDIRAWDSETGEVFDIGTAARVDGEPVSGPFVIPVASEGKAAWVQANEQGMGEVHLYDLAGREDRVLPSGSAAPPVLFWDSKLLWVDRSRGLAMADAKTGEPVTVPEPLAQIHSFATLAAAGEVVAWSEDFRNVKIWRVGDPRAAVLFEAAERERVDWLAVVGDLVTWSGNKRQMAADLRSGSIAPLTQRPGFKSVNRNWLLTVDPIDTTKGVAGERMSVPPPEIDLVDVTELPPLPGCPS